MKLFQGRVSRGLYFWTIVSINAIFAFVNYARWNIVSDEGAYLLKMLILLSTAVSLLVMTISVNIRRLHDIGKSGWWALLGLIPFFNILIILYLIFAIGQGKNKYGTVPDKYLF